MRVSLKKEEIVLLCLDFLKQSGFIKAMRALEEESLVKADTYGREIDFLRTLVLDGQWADVEKFMQPLMVRLCALGSCLSQDAPNPADAHGCVCIESCEF